MLKRFRIPLYWWSGKHQCNENFENFGDLLSKYVIEEITGRKVIWVYPKSRKVDYIFKKSLLAIGSILHNAEKNSIVWGSGILNKNLIIREAKYICVRGPLTRYELLNKGINVPDIYGDPALLSSIIFPTKAINKIYNIGIIPHYSDYIQFLNKNVNKENNIISPLLNPIDVIENINSCRLIFSSSLHGIILSLTYNIPVVFFVLNDELIENVDFKYIDFFKSLDIEFKPFFITSNDIQLFVNKEKISSEYIIYPDRYQIKIENMNKKLLEIFPYNEF